MAICPTCQGAMATTKFKRQPKGGAALPNAEIDLCNDCHGLWFDKNEVFSLQPDDIAELLRSVLHLPTSRRITPEMLLCPHCDQPLIKDRDWVKNGAISFWCPQAHGRFIELKQYAIEKWEHLRLLSEEDASRLKTGLGIQDCVTCGAPVEIDQGEVCNRCKPLPLPAMPVAAATSASNKLSLAKEFCGVPASHLRPKHDQKAKTTTLKPAKPIAVNSRNIPCSGCGFRLEYTPGLLSLKCNQCGAETPIQIADLVERTQALKELDLPAAIAEQFTTLHRQQLQIVVCSSCGAGLQMPNHMAADRCPFCSMPIIVKQEQSREMLLPSAILPFRLSDQSAQNYFKRWLRDLWLVPNDFRRNIKLQGVRGVYLPYLTYDAHLRINYEGERGVKNISTKKMEWTKTKRKIEGMFDDMLAAASQAMPHDLLDRLAPWPLSRLEPYRDGYVSGFTAELSRIDLKDGLEEVRQRMQEDILERVKKSIGGEQQRRIVIDAHVNKLTFKYVLLPAWLATGKFKGKTYRFVINGHTGKVEGEHPRSIFKVLALGLAFGIVTIALIYNDWGWGLPVWGLVVLFVTAFLASRVSPNKPGLNFVKKKADNE